MQEHIVNEIFSLCMLLFNQIKYSCFVSTNLECRRYIRNKLKNKQFYNFVEIICWNSFEIKKWVLNEIALWKNLGI
jgi:hypothetical protein